MKFNFSAILSVFVLASTANSAAVKRSGLTQNEKDTLLNLHKATRNAVNASNMKNISWDKNLEKEAQNYAAKCVFQHDKNRNGHGENLARGSYDDVARYYKLWEKEKSDFESAKVLDNFKGGSYGHYSQIVWADNTKIGCGYQYCSSDNRYMLVCRYLTGNIIGHTVYVKGKNNVQKPQPQESTDGKCGDKYGKCPGNECCSKYGYCGTTSDYCGADCQSAFGKCNTTNPPPKVDDRECGNGIGKCPNNECCSEWGYCGTTKEYCGTGCQSKFGLCK